MQSVIMLCGIILSVIMLNVVILRHGLTIDECHCAKWHIFNVMLSGSMLSVIMMNVVWLSVFATWPYHSLYTKLHEDLLDFPSIHRLGQKQLVVTNALAYYLPQEKSKINLAHCHT